MTNEADDIQAVEKLGQARDAIVAELRKAIVGLDDVIDEMMIAIFARGHCLLVGVPGLAKTLLVSSLAQTMSLSSGTRLCSMRRMASRWASSLSRSSAPSLGRRPW